MGEGGGWMVFQKHGLEMLAKELGVPSERRRRRWKKKEGTDVDR